MKLIWVFLLLITFSSSLFANSEKEIFDIDNSCYEISPLKENLLTSIEDFTCYKKMMGEEVDCSVLRNYRDENGHWVCPTVDYDACLKKYGPRLPPSYFQFVKNWCYCNCIYDPED